MIATEKAIEKKIHVSTHTVSEFFQKDLGVIALPPYQRPYVWNRQKIEQLFQDLLEHFFNYSKGKFIFDENAPLYYLGSVLFHENADNEKFYIIDGQQRITTLLLIDKKVHKSSSILDQGKWNLNYNSRLSTAHIKKNFVELTSYEHFNVIADYLSSIYSKLVLSFIVTNSEDDAFTFFDSQNNRGVSLDAVDFLKSYHLRELKEKEEEQKVFVKKWDSNNAGQALNHLFEIVLWRSRNWKGNAIQFENKDLILESFQKNTKQTNGAGIKLYANKNNVLATSLSFTAQKGLKLELAPLFVQASPEEYPFALRQPIYKGVGFFLYVEKYYHLYNILFQTDGNEYVMYVSKNLIKDYNYYFQNFFKLLVVMYYDKFKDEQLFAFMLWTDYLLGAFRVNQATIVSQTAVKILRDYKQNLIDVIEAAYDPEDIIDFIKHYKISGNDLKAIYAKTINEYGAENGIRNRYRKTVLDFYGIDEKSPLTEKYLWIANKINSSKHA